MPLNYSKWDALEISDDSDIEGHPNVDHKSLVRWKQRDIHEKREARKRRIAEYKAIISLNDVLIPRVRQILKDVQEGGAFKYSAIVEKLQRQSSQEKPPGGQATYDEMICRLLLTIRDELKEGGYTTPTDEQLARGIQGHLDKMVKTDKDSKEALADEEAEQKKKITSDDIHDGFSATNVVKDPEEISKAKGKEKVKSEETDKNIEVLNPEAPSHSSLVEGEGDLDDDEERIPELNPTLLAFSKIPIGAFDKDFGFIQKHSREVMKDGVYDALVIAGFRAAMKGDIPYAKQCVHQGLIVQYCQKLGKDGVRLFFTKMSQSDKKAQAVFDKDFHDTYTMMLDRAAKAKKEEENPQERIQLVAEDPSHSITFNVPDGPPPEEIKLEGPGTENLDPVEVRQALQQRWDIFNTFDDELKVALKMNSLDHVNDVLGDMDVARAEDVVKLLQIAGILNFSQSGVVDQTGKDGNEADSESEDEENDEENDEGKEGAFEDADVPAAPAPQTSA